MGNLYCCVDVEASGPAPGLNDLVSLGAVAVRLGPEGRHVLADAPPFHVEFQPQGGVQEPEAMAVHGITDERLRAHGRPVAEGLALLDAWAKDAAREGERLVFVGHNAPFDWAFVNHAYHACRRRNPFGWKALDTKALAMGVLDLDWFDTNKETLARLLPEIGEQDASRVHRADYDALYQARILVALLDHPRRRRAMGR